MRAEWNQETTRERGARVRRERIEAARARTGGAHAYNDWLVLRDIFGACVACGTTIDEVNLHRDHIVPLAVGGCDCIANIQPLCGYCNHNKENCWDYRFSAKPTWFREYVEAMAVRRPFGVFMGFNTQ